MDFFCIDRFLFYIFSIFMDDYRNNLVNNIFRSMLLLLWVLFGFIFCSAAPNGFHLPVTFDEDYEEIENDDRGYIN